MQIQEFPKMLVREADYCIAQDEAEELAKREDGWLMAHEVVEAEPLIETTETAETAETAEEGSASTRKKKAG